MSTEENVTLPANRSAWEDFNAWYSNYNGYVRVVLCTFGIPFSILVITVLNRRHMVNPTNYILTALAVSDLLVMASYLPNALVFNVLHVPTNDSIAAKVASRAFYATGLTAHAASVWLAVALSVARYVILRSSTHSGWMTVDLRCARIIVVLVVTGSVVILIPKYFRIALIEESAETASFVNWCRIVHRAIHAFVIGLVPIVLMSVFSSLLMFTLHRAHRRGIDLLKRRRPTVMHDGTSRTVMHDGSSHIAERRGSRQNRRQGRQRRTTVMLIVVIVLFIASEAPTAVLLTSIFISNFSTLSDRYKNRTLPLVLTDIMLLNCGINFMLYCTMSGKFRATFSQLLRFRSTVSSPEVTRQISSLDTTSNLISVNSSTNVRALLQKPKLSTA